MQLTKNFILDEFRCNDGTAVPEIYISNVKELANNLQILRDYLNEPVFITGSGYRTPFWNAKVGGVKNSEHLVAKAADINVKSKTPKQLASVIEKLIKAGKMKEGGIGVYNGFVHYDVRGTKARW
ncbi:D-Ala-D-Ala carboxypeptidase family metallohydrolase [Flavobacterium sediminilitoris]|uniref:D-Ala-D-Ala carboxypeptidase family metallohydrolase n=1 Tax=Flavobacterium sediminilitoris TaxID=2024526 RepID=A0ABY4HUT9_9FLAO|nr:MULTISPECIES: D-Ala-D-Ala carboxypeptidase family metallohydrolase [Flavobacterium]UOX35319.1 D-Ala-D-Ala carboxypeptidase family metallohydrolase [Flavobacterium sediminilitoris]